MADIDALVRPVPLRALASAERNACPELADLEALRAAGVRVTELIVIPAAAEERFYRLNNLPRRLHAVFDGVDVEDPDEDDVEDAFPAARTLVAESYLLDEFIDAFYDATAPLPVDLRVRRPSGDGELAGRGRPSLLAYKHLLQDDWSFDAVWHRLQRAHSIGLEARPVVFHDADEKAADAKLSSEAAALVGAPVALQMDGTGAVTRVRRLT